MDKKNDQLILTEAEGGQLARLFSQREVADAALNHYTDPELLAAVAEALTAGLTISRKAAPETKKEAKP